MKNIQIQEAWWGWATIAKRAGRCQRAVIAWRDTDPSFRKLIRKHRGRVYVIPDEMREWLKKNPRAR